MIIFCLERHLMLEGELDTPEIYSCIVKYCFKKLYLLLLVFNQFFSIFLAKLSCFTSC